MRRVVLALLATAIGLFLLLSYKAHTPTTVSSALTSPNPGTDTGSTPTAAPTAGSGSGSGTTSGSSTASTGSSSPTSGTIHNGTFVGDAATSQFSTIQVEVTVSGGKITDITVVQDADDDQHSAEVDAFAIPTLRSEALSAQSANIDAVSGATYTSQSYTQSLQSALDKAAS
jgi:uncharacterized protein with FMN-binding domain